MERFVILFLLAFVGAIQGLIESHNQENFEPKAENEEWAPKKDQINDSHLNFIPYSLKQQHLLEQQLLKQKQQQELQKWLEKQQKHNIKQQPNKQPHQQKNFANRKNNNVKCNHHLKIHEERPTPKFTRNYSKMIRPKYQNTEMNLPNNPKKHYYHSSTTEAAQPGSSSASSELSENEFSSIPILDSNLSTESTTETDIISTSVSDKQTDSNSSLRKTLGTADDSEINSEAASNHGRKQLSPAPTLKSQHPLLSNKDAFTALDTLQDLSLSNTNHYEISGSKSNVSAPKTVILPVKTSQNVKCYRNDLMIICID